MNNLELFNKTTLMKKDKNKTNTKESSKELVYVAQKLDPLGSYTGKPINPNDKPLQDADDL